MVRLGQIVATTNRLSTLIHKAKHHLRRCRRGHIPPHPKQTTHDPGRGPTPEHRDRALSFLDLFCSCGRVGIGLLVRDSDNFSKGLVVQTGPANQQPIYVI